MLSSIICTIAAFCVIIPDIPVVNLSAFAVMCYITLRWVSDLEFYDFFYRMMFVTAWASCAAMYKYFTLTFWYVFLIIIFLYWMKWIIGWKEKQIKTENSRMRVS